MEVRFTPKEQARIARIATQEGLDPAELVKDAALRPLEDDARFLARVTNIPALIRDPNQSQPVVTTYSYRHSLTLSFYMTYTVPHVNSKPNSPQSSLPSQESIHRPLA